jgi:hypothetical protein
MTQRVALNQEVLFNTNVLTSTCTLLHSRMYLHWCAQVFGMDTFYVTATERSPLAVLFRGNLRAQDSSEVFAAIQTRLAAEEGLSDRVQLLLMPDPSPFNSAGDMMASQESGEPR